MPSWTTGAYNSFDLSCGTIRTMKVILKKTGSKPIDVKPSFHNIKTYAMILMLRALRKMVVVFMI
jgi:hypothetical protein